MFPVCNLLLWHPSLVLHCMVLNVTVSQLYLFYRTQLEEQREPKPAQIKPQLIVCVIDAVLCIIHAVHVWQHSSFSIAQQSWLFFSVQWGWMEGEDAQPQTINTGFNVLEAAALHKRCRICILLSFIHYNPTFSWEHCEALAWEASDVQLTFTTQQFTFFLQPEPIMLLQRSVGGSEPYN